MKNSTAGLNKAWEVSFTALFALVFVMFPDLAFAFNYVQPTNGSSAQISAVGDAVCLMGSAFAGEVAAGIATIGVCTVGTLACVGRVQWMSAFLVAVGISTIFGAGALISWLTGGGYCN